jgi:LCP family protein required for cell wall assembly
MLCILLGTMLAVGSFGGLASAYMVANRYDNKIDREDFGTTGRAGSATGPMNILLIGSDSREGGAYNPNDPSSTTATVQGQRSDTLMLFHIPASMDRAYGISFERDSYVDIPPVPGKWNGGKDKLNAALAYGGEKHVVATIEQMSGLTVDYVVVVNFDGVTKVVDAVGGIDMTVPAPIRSIHTKKVYAKGTRHFNGADALDYVRQRKQFQAGDYARMANQQALLKALAKKMTSTDIITNPVKLDKVLRAATEAFKVDQNLPVKDLAYSLRGLRPGDLTFFTAPIERSEKVNGADVEIPDEAKQAQLFDAVKSDSIDQYLVQNPPKAPSTKTCFTEC